MISRLRNHPDPSTATKETTKMKALTRLLSIAILSLALGLLIAGPAAASSSPVWELHSDANTTAPVGGTIAYTIALGDVGHASTSGPVTLTVKLPTGLSAESLIDFLSRWTCPASVTGLTEIVCTRSDSIEPHGGGISAGSNPGGIDLFAAVEPGAEGVLTSTVELSGGGAPTVTTADPTRIEPGSAGFGLDAFDAQVSAADGSAYTQAAGHPASASTYIDFNRNTDADPSLGSPYPVQSAKDILADLPAGFIGDPTVAATCTLTQLTAVPPGVAGTSPKSTCPPSSQLGVATLVFAGGGFPNIFKLFLGFPPIPP